MSQQPPYPRLRLDIRGAVQGVGFRPHVFRLARRLGVSGWVLNDHRGVRIEVEGPRDVLTLFADSLLSEPPRQARIGEVERSWIPPEGDTDFHIRDSPGGGTPEVAILPDLATCQACMEDVLRDGDRRQGYPFTNCTDCGPRFSIIVRLPYDRPLTTMAGFTQCDACRAEYTSPEDRRFHAQPNACPRCGPGLSWWDSGQRTPDSDPDALPLDRAAEALREGWVVAVQGLGGFHLMVDATAEAAVARLRSRKGRGAKPFALMVRDLSAAEGIVEVDAVSAELLTSSASPIVLLPRRPRTDIAWSVAPDNPRLGVVLAYTPLHALLLDRLGRPVVATSGNRSEEPICIDADEARDRLSDIADGFLIHDRPIRRHVDDSVARPGPEGPVLLRRARGYAPLPLPLDIVDRPTLAVGGHLKNTVAVARDGQVWLSQHIGDLDAPETLRAFRDTVRDFMDLYRVQPEGVAHDLHPGYASTRYVVDEVEEPVRRIPVQHHHAHLASVLAEHRSEPDAVALGVIWDGTGFGTDGTVWGGEFLVGGYREFRRAAHLRTFRLPGGEAAVREPRRSALGLLVEAGLLGVPGTEEALGSFDAVERRVMEQAMHRRLNAPETSSAGRLFDGLASILGLRHHSDFEGDAAIRLEHAALRARHGTSDPGGYPLELRPGPGGGRILDWEPLVRAVLEDRRRGVATDRIALRIHNGLAAGIAALAREVGTDRVALSGGCFANALLTEEARDTLRRQGHTVLLHRHVPPGDGGLALGQIAVAAAREPGDRLRRGAG